MGRRSSTAGVEVPSELLSLVRGRRSARSRCWSLVWLSGVNLLCSSSQIGGIWVMRDTIASMPSQGKALFYLRQWPSHILLYSPPWIMSMTVPVGCHKLMRTRERDVRVPVPVGGPRELQRKSL